VLIFVLSQDADSSRCWSDQGEPGDDEGVESSDDGSGQSQSSRVVEDDGNKKYVVKRAYIRKKKGGVRVGGMVTKYVCKLCPSTFFKLGSVQHHVSFHGAKNKYKCRVCNYSVTTGANAARYA
jgi:hypothetical protein